MTALRAVMLRFQVVLPVHAAAPRRIFITGQGGSGKSTLARQLAARCSLPCYLFDDIAYAPETHRRRSDELRFAAVREVAAQPAWVVDCWYMGWTEALLQRADLIIWLDLPWRVTAWRILRRHVLADLSGHNPHPGLRRLFTFLLQQRQGYLEPAVPSADLLRRDANNVATTARILAGYSPKMLRCRRPAEVAALVRALRTPAV